MSDAGYKIRNQNAIHFITFSVIKWVDALTRKEYKDILIDSLKHCQENKGLLIHCWVIMNNHVHFILSAIEGFKLSNILRDFKKHTSSKILETMEENDQDPERNRMLDIFRKAGRENIRNSNYQFWQQDNHPKELFGNSMIEQKMDYIHNNPVKAGIVDNPEDYIYSSARDYAGIKGLLDIEFLD